MKGKNKATIFLPLHQCSGGPIQYVKDRENIGLTSDQARCIHKKVEKDGLVNVEMITQKQKRID